MVLQLNLTPLVECSAGKGNLSGGILAINKNLAGRQFKDIIVDTGSAVSLISTLLRDQFHEKFTRNQVRSKYVVANRTTLPVEGSTELPIQIGGLDVIYCFIIVCTEFKIA